jgi:hypothetical protein
MAAAARRVLERGNRPPRTRRGQSESSGPHLDRRRERGMIARACSSVTFTPSRSSALLRMSQRPGQPARRHTPTAAEPKDFP